MKILGYKFGKEEVVKDASDGMVNEDFGAIGNIPVGDRDLSKPYVDDSYVGGNGMVYFGEENLYPNLLNNLYRSSPIHATCVNFKTNAIVGGGYEFKGYDEATLDKKKDIKKLEIRLKLKELTRGISQDFIKHGRACVLLTYSEEKKTFVKARLIDPENVRNTRVSIYEDKPSHYFLSEDWRRYGINKIVPCHHLGCKDKYQMLELRTNTAGLKTYPLPDYVSNGNWTYLDGEISYLYKQGIVNSINPSMIFKFPFETTPGQKQKIRRMLETVGKGARNMGRILTFYKPADQQPEIETVKTTQNDKLYAQVSQEIKDNIAISHQIDPAVIGIKTTGKLGNAAELKMQYQLFEKNWVMENRDTIEEFINDVLGVFHCELEFQFNTFNIIDEEIVETKIEEE